MRKNILDFTLRELEEQILGLGEKKFRASQIFRQLHNKNIRNFDELKNIPKEFIGKIKDTFILEYLELLDIKKSSLDKTKKFLFQIPETKDKIESVLISEKDRNTICVSTQAGCNAGCEFCATGKIGFKKNLSAGEILAQIYTVSMEIGEKPTNIVYMGMGEPLLNYHEVIRSVEKISGESGLAMSPQRITVSTVGIAPMIRRLGDDQVKFNLALSLHSAINEKRNQIIPYNLRNSLGDLVEAVRHFHDRTKTRITIEYVMLKEFNDNMEDAKALADFCRNFPVKVNLIQYNPVENSPYQDSGKDRTEAFKEYLDRLNMVVNIRRSRGKDIDAACGQLANKLIHNNS